MARLIIFFIEDALYKFTFWLIDWLTDWGIWGEQLGGRGRSGSAHVAGKICLHGDWRCQLHIHDKNPNGPTICRSQPLFVPALLQSHDESYMLAGARACLMCHVGRRCACAVRQTVTSLINTVTTMTKYDAAFTITTQWRSSSSLTQISTSSSSEISQDSVGRKTHCGHRLFIR